MRIKNCYSYGNNCPCLDCERECNGCADLLSRDLSFDTEKLCTLAKDYCEAVNGHKVGEKMSDKTSDKRLLPCPICGSESIYETKRENELGTIIPQLFCNHCKMIFEIENDSPYLNDDKTHDYLKEKLYVWWNTRKPMERIVKQLEVLKMAEFDDSDEEPMYTDFESIYDVGMSDGKYKAYYKAIEIVKEEGGMNER